MAPSLMQMKVSTSTLCILVCCTTHVLLSLKVVKCCITKISFSVSCYSLCAYSALCGCFKQCTLETALFWNNFIEQEVRSVKKSKRARRRKTYRHTVYGVLLEKMLSTSSVYGCIAVLHFWMSVNLLTTLIGLQSGDIRKVLTPLHQTCTHNGTVLVVFSAAPASSSEQLNSGGNSNLRCLLRDSLVVVCSPSHSAYYV